jgi:hypothetical protein
LRLLVQAMARQRQWAECLKSRVFGNFLNQDGQTQASYRKSRFKGMRAL